MCDLVPILLGDNETSCAVRNACSSVFILSQSGKQEGLGGCLPTLLSLELQFSVYQSSKYFSVKPELVNLTDMVIRIQSCWSIGRILF